ncbi:hypothetical protein Hanom_Chr04g00357631 [Helianthus anomalus]
MKGKEKLACCLWILEQPIMYIHTVSVDEKMLPCINQWIKAIFLLGRSNLTLLTHFCRCKRVPCFFPFLNYHLSSFGPPC